MNLPLRMGVAATLAMILPSVPSRAEPAPTVPDATLDAYAAPAESIDIGGRRLDLRCSGSGTPTVLLEAGQGMSSMSWRKVQPALARSMRVCAYDRAGLGFSDPAPLPRTARAEADDLHALVRSAKLAPPLVLVGHSLGSYIVRLYVDAHRADVAGLVLVDPVSETFAQDAPDAAAREAKMSAENTEYGRRCGEAAHKGDLARATPAAQACVPPPNPGFSTRLNDVLRARVASPSYWDTGLSERESDAANVAAVRAARTPLGALPLVVLAADGTNDGLAPAERAAADAGYDAGRKRIASLSSAGRVVRVAHSSHNVQEDRPDAIIEAVEHLAAQWRRKP